MISMQALCVCLDYQLALSTPIDAWLCRTYVQAQHTWPANLLSRPCKFGLRMFSIFSAKNYSRHLRFSRLLRAGQRKKFLLRRFLHRALKKQRSACPKKKPPHHGLHQRVHVNMVPVLLPRQLITMVFHRLGTEFMPCLLQLTETDKHE